jgi:hypothetical protein
MPSRKAWCPVGTPERLMRHRKAAPIRPNIAVSDRDLRHRCQRPRLLIKYLPQTFPVGETVDGVLRGRRPKTPIAGFSCSTRSVSVERTARRGDQRPRAHGSCRRPAFQTEKTRSRAEKRAAYPPLFSHFPLGFPVKNRVGRKSDKYPVRPLNIPSGVVMLGASDTMQLLPV